MGNIRLYGSTSGYTELAPPAVAPDGVLSLPTGTGTLATQASVGLVKIVDQSFTAASSVSVNNCFTSDYKNYCMVIDCVASADVGISFRLRASGTDRTGANYNYQRLYADGTTVGATRVSSGTTGRIGVAFTAQNGLVCHVFNPFDSALNTSTVSQVSYAYNNISLESFANRYAVNDSNDGFTIYPSSGNITGTLRVYGYQN
ncbi:MAG TPA: hypothetical protein VLA24_15165 [Pseudomonadales bacterium]|nr:hypothetical protein [Pseudomonadales bacterium]